MVWNSRDAAVAQRHRGLVQVMKEKRAEGHFAGLPLEQRIQVYDSAMPAHARSLKSLGLTGQKLPLLCLTQLNAQGVPAKILWKTQYGGADQALVALNQRMGIVDKNQSKDPPELVVVGAANDPARLEAEAKLNSLMGGAWKGARLHGPWRGEESLAEVTGPALALLDPKDQHVLWQKPLNQPDVVMQALGQRLGLVYQAPDQLAWKDGSTLLRVSGGYVYIGRDGANPDCPRTRIQLQPYYYMGRTEVTVGQFRKFAAETNYVTDAERAGKSNVFTRSGWNAVEGANWRKPHAREEAQDSAPVVHITYNDAMAYCNWAGVRLPSEAEWENATGLKDYPWGNEWRPEALRHSVGKGLGGAESPVSVGSFKGGASPWGLLDMAGNVYEWTGDVYGPYFKGAPTNSRMNGLRHVIRGGSFGNDEAKDFHTYLRVGVGSDATEAQGFRVCLNGTRLNQ